MKTTKQCSDCKQVKPVSEFYKSNTRYYQHECKDCNRQRKHKWHQTESGKRSSANTKLKRRFGITIEEYEELVSKAGNQCEICGAITSYGGHRLAVDHDHKTGKVRGILCKACNTGLGGFKDSIGLCQQAIKYLSKSN